MPIEHRNIGKELSKKEAKLKISRIKWKRDHRGTHYNPKTGIVTAR